MKREIIKTADGSATIFLPEWNEHYHSKHGALQEAEHVFIEAGLKYKLAESNVTQLDILEIGFGTGLNAMVTYFAAAQAGLRIDYTGTEAYPVSGEELEKLEYGTLFNSKDAVRIFQELHQAPWGKRSGIGSFFSIKKDEIFFQDIQAEAAYDLVFFDAFGPRVQPDLWTEEIFAVMFRALREEGVLVTYSAKGSVRRAMESVGFAVARIPGPPGKREMLRAIKKSGSL